MQEERPVGPVIEGWRPPPRPEGPRLEGRYAALEPVRAAHHAEPLHRALRDHDAVWDYIPSGPFPEAAAFHDWLRAAEGRPDPHVLAIRDRDSDTTGGLAAFMRIVPEHGVIEVGGIVLAPVLQRSRAATEAMVLMMAWAFEAGYRRYEWKCDALNRPSRRAAQRLGFSYEGTFRQHMVIKGRNRDTAWFAITDGDWPALKQAFALWLAPGNFDAAGRQRTRLSDRTRDLRRASDPTL